MEIKKIKQQDKEDWLSLDRHLSEEEFENKVNDQMGYTIWKDGSLAGIFRWNMFWDNIPFVTLILIEAGERNQGIGRMVMETWEKEMKAKGYKVVMTSTQVDEDAQNFYRKIGYKDCGCLVLDIPELEQPMEMFLIKRI